MGMAEKARRAVKRAIQRNRAAPAYRAPILPTPEPRRTDRVRPRQRANADTRWHCRPSGQRHHSQGELARGTRETLTLEDLAARRFILFCAQEGMCMICALVLSPHDASVDHIVPMFLGGDDEDGNYALVHRLCNSVKANDEPTGCELVWMFSINARIGANPIMW